MRKGQSKGEQFKYGWHIVPYRLFDEGYENRGQFSIVINENMHLAFECWNPGYWTVAVMHKDHHVGGRLKFERNRWTFQRGEKYPDGFYEKWVEKSVTPPFDLEKFMNESPDVKAAFRVFKIAELKRFRRYMVERARHLYREMTVSLPKRYAKECAKLEKMQATLEKMGVRVHDTY